MISSVDNAWIDAVAHRSESKDDSLYARGEARMNDDDFHALRNQYEQFYERFRLFNQRFLVACLHLPAAQHIAVPAKPSTGCTVYESAIPIVKHAFNSKTWHELCHVEQSDVSIFGPYWLGAATLRKHEFVNTICSELIQLGFQEMSSTSMTKAFIHEALGANINESRDVLTTFASFNDSRSRSLITSGIGSLASILVPFIRRIFLQSDLPYVVFTQGATYDANQEQAFKIQLLAMTHIGHVHLKNVHDPLVDHTIHDLHLARSSMPIDHDNEYLSKLKERLKETMPYRFEHGTSLEDLFLELARLMHNIYEKFRLPYRIQNCSSDQLQTYESMRLNYELFLPSTNSYVCVGSLSLIGDYLSRRLMIRHKRVKDEKYTSMKDKKFDPDDLPRETNFNYVQMIHAQVVDVDMLTKCYVEKEQRRLSDNKIT
jgi:hypothetical protein